VIWGQRFEGMRELVNVKEDMPIGKAKTIMFERWCSGENFRNIHK